MKITWKNKFIMLVPTCLCCLAIASLMGVRVNCTTSMPRGVYLTSKTQPTTGDLVSYCLMGSWADLARKRQYLASGSCKSGLRPLLKVLAGVSGDSVTVESGTVWINGQAWSHGQIKTVDSSGRPVPSCLEPGTIPDGFALILSPTHDGSFDGRYFGFVPLGELQLVIPLLTSGDKYHE